MTVLTNTPPRVSQSSPGGMQGITIMEPLLAKAARKLNIDPETALRGGTRKFERRFHSIEAALAAEGRRPTDASLDEMEALWVAAKRAERTGE